MMYKGTHRATPGHFRPVDRTVRVLVLTVLVLSGLLGSAGALAYDGMTATPGAAWCPVQALGPFNPCAHLDPSQVVDVR